jgi:hypothetical protein
VHQEITLGLGLCGALVVSHGQRVLAVFVDLRETLPVRLLGLRIKQWPGVQAQGDSQASLDGAFDFDGAPGRIGDHLEHVKIAPATRERAREVSQALQVPQTYRLPLKHHGPVLTLAVKDILVGCVAPGRRMRMRLALRPGRVVQPTSPHA